MISVVDCALAAPEKIGDATVTVALKSLIASDVKTFVSTSTIIPLIQFAIALSFLQSVVRLFSG